MCIRLCVWWGIVSVGLVWWGNGWRRWLGGECFVLVVVVKRIEESFRAHEFVGAWALANLVSEEWVGCDLMYVVDSNVGLCNFGFVEFVTRGEQAVFEWVCFGVEDGFECL